MLQEGDKAPLFSLSDKDGKVHALKTLEADFKVLYFYPKDNTPGCTIEAVEFQGRKAAFAKLGAMVIGISGGDEKSKQKFCGKHGLDFTLLSDPEFAVASAYGAYGKKSFMGRLFKGVHRMTFVLDSKNRILRVFPKVKAKGHAEEVLGYLKELRSGGS